MKFPVEGGRDLGSALALPLTPRVTLMRSLPLAGPFPIVPEEGAVLGG